MSTSQFTSDDLAALRQIFSCIDNTTLEGSDTKSKVEQLCTRSLQIVDKKQGLGPVAAVCVYPVFVRQASQLLQGSGIRVASVAGAFPAGQSPIAVKVAEVQYALDQGADEIDMVLSRGTLIEGDEQRVYDEVAAIRETCMAKTLKVILETGELPSPTLITRASEIAIAAGADFIKTSTGKIAVSATPDAAQIMLHTIRVHHQKTGKWVGFKAAGGISTPEQALVYYRLALETFGKEQISNQIFRIGASRLTERVFTLLT